MANAIVRGIRWFTHPLAIAFQEWFDATVKEVILAEAPVWNPTYHYAGSLDLIAILKGDCSKPSVIDIKTTGSISKEVGLQLAAYKEAAIITYGIKPERRLVVHLDKKNPGAKARAQDFPDPNDYPMYLYALSLEVDYAEAILSQPARCGEPGSV